VFRTILIEHFALFRLNEIERLTLSKYYKWFHLSPHS
jgi:hypothetical protein